MTTITPEDLAERLDAVRAKRGYLLPHHGLMALTSPDLLAAYDALYTAMTLEERILDAHDKEFVWLLILIATDEALATHHIAKFRKANGTDAEIEVALALSALGLGVRAHHFVANHWQHALPTIDAERNFRNAQRALSGDVPARLVHLGLIALLAAKADWSALRWQLRAAYADAVPEGEIAEALSLMMFPGSVPYFVEACGVWREMIEHDELPASPAYVAWARLAGQGGFDEANKGTSHA